MSARGAAAPGGEGAHPDGPVYGCPCHLCRHAFGADAPAPCAHGGGAKDLFTCGYSEGYRAAACGLDPSPGARWAGYASAGVGAAAAARDRVAAAAVAYVMAHGAPDRTVTGQALGEAVLAYQRAGGAP